MMKFFHLLYAGACVLLLGVYTWAEYQGHSFDYGDLDRLTHGSSRGSSYSSHASHK